MPKINDFVESLTENDKDCTITVKRKNYYNLSYK